MALRRLWRAGVMLGGAALALAGVGAAAAPTSVGTISMTGAAGQMPSRPALLRPGALTVANPRPAAAGACVIGSVLVAPPTAGGASSPRASLVDRSHRAVFRPRIRSPDRRVG